MISSGVTQSIKERKMLDEVGTLFYKLIKETLYHWGIQSPKIYLLPALHYFLKIFFDNMDHQELCRDFSGDPVVKNLLSNAGNADSIPGWGTKIPYSAGQLSLHTATRESPRTAVKTQCSPQKRKKRVMQSKLGNSVFSLVCFNRNNPFLREKKRNL